MGVIRNGPINLVDCVGKCTLGEFARGNSAAQVARRESRSAHIGRERNGRNDDERKDAKHYQESRTSSFHLRSSAESR